MTGLESLGLFFNIVIITIMVVSGLWVGLNAKKTGLSLLESVLWAFFAGSFIIVGPVCYIYFKKNFYK